ncbi:MAG: cell division protein FtsB [Pseudomonadota bacterium]
MKVLLVLLIALLLALQYKLWIDDGGLQEVWRLTQQVEAHEQEIATLRERNNALAAEVIDLKSGLGAVEERARTDLGMIRSGETFYHLIGDDADSEETIQRDSAIEESQ